MKITNLKIKNFKSLENLEIDFDPKANINLIYGINGSGKTTLLDALTYISTFLNVRKSRIVSLITESLMRNDEFDEYIYDDERMGNSNEFKISSHRRKNMSSAKRWGYNEIVTKQSELGELIEISLEFIDENEFEQYAYSISIGEGDVIYNEALTKNAANIFNIRRKNESEFEEITIENSSVNFEKLVFNNLNQKMDLSHFKNISLIPILKYAWFADAEENNVVFETISKVQEFFDGSTLRRGASSNSFNRYIHRMHTTEFYNVENESEIRTHESFVKFNERMQKLTDFLIEVDETIIGFDIDVDVEVSDDEIKNGKYHVTLKLLLKKIIGGKIRDIPFENESTGTLKYLSIYLMINEISNTTKNSLIIYDEIGASFNETLLLNIFNYIEKISRKNNKQLIITTHNTVLLQKKFSTNYDESSFLWNKEKIILYRDSKGRNRFTNLTGIDKKENNQLKYLMGSYKGNSLRGLFEDE